MTDAPYTYTARPLEETVFLEYVGEFIVSLLQALLRTGYYLPDHPESRKAKEGLYKRFTAIAGGHGVLSLMLCEEHGKRALLVEGVSENPVKFSSMMQRGVAETYSANLVKFFDRKEIISLSMTYRLDADEFSRFIDIMSEPLYIDSDQTSVKDLFTHSLIENDVCNVSFIFNEEFIIQRPNIPWRARMALSRLKKDIRLIPLLANKSDDDLRAVKMQLITDILRPLNSADLLYSLLLNLDMAVSPLLSEDDAENVFFELIRENLLMLVGTCFIRDMLAETGDFPEHVTPQKKARILANLSQRLNHSTDARAGAVLETLFNSGLITLEDLPLAVKNRVLTIKRLANFLVKPDTILRSFDKTTETDIYEFRALTMISLVPLLIQRGEIKLAIEIVKMLNRHAMENSRRSPFAIQKRTELVFGETPALASELFLTASKETRTIIGELFQAMGHGTIPHLQEILIRSKDIWRCKQAAEILAAMGGRAMLSLVSAIEGHLLNSVSLAVILRELYELPQCIPLELAVRVCMNHLDNTDADVRREALTGLVRLEPVGRFSVFSPRLKDPDLRIRKIAAGGLGKSGDPRAFALLTALVDASEKSDWNDERALGIACIEALGALMMSCPALHDRIGAWFASQVCDQCARSSWMKILPVSSAPSAARATTLTETVGKLPDEVSRSLLARLAQHQTPAVAHRAGELLGRMSAPASAT